MWGQHPGETTAYVGSHFEWMAVKITARSTSTMRKYYYAGGERVAVRVGTTLSYLLNDHLGSTSVTTSSTGAKTGEELYHPWGDDRYTWGTTPTDFRYTGQRRQAELGLYFYQARWYDPALGRFAQADSLVPLESQGVQAWDRYAGMNNNPVRYNDPTGHDVGNPGKNGFGSINPIILPGWDPSYGRRQIGNTCAVYSAAAAMSVLLQTPVDPLIVQNSAGRTRVGIGVWPSEQTDMVNGSDLGVTATYSQGNRGDLITNLVNGDPTIVSVAYPASNGVGHALLVTGYDPETNGFIFFDPAVGKEQNEDVYNNYLNTNFRTTFHQAWLDPSYSVLSRTVIRAGGMVTLKQDENKLPVYSGNVGSAYTGWEVSVK